MSYTDNGLILTKDFTGEDGFESSLSMFDNERSDIDTPRRFSLQGDLCPLFGIDDYFAPDGEGHFGHYTVENKIIRYLAVTDITLLKQIEFESEGGTFFCYAHERKPLDDLLTQIENMAQYVL